MSARRPRVIAMSSHEFDIKFDGPATQDFTMDVKELGPALIAIAEAIQEASRIMMPTAPLPALRIKAKGNEASWGANLLLLDWEEAPGQAITFLNAAGVVAIVHAKDLLDIVIHAVDFLKARRGRSIASQIPDGDGMIRVTYADGTETNVSRDVLRVGGSITFTHKVETSANSVDGTAITQLSINSGSVSTTIAAEDRPSFRPVEDALDDDLLPGGTRQAVLYPVVVSLRGDYIWRFIEDGRLVNAYMVDPDFLQRVRQDEPFKTSDVLVVQLRTDVTTDPSGRRKVENFVERVIAHRPGGEQGALELKP